MIDLKDWQKVNDWESKWWDNCTNTFIEEVKQMQIAKYMGLTPDIVASHVQIDVEGKNILDLGGGVTSMLLKAINRGSDCIVVDPILAKCPKWVLDRYASADIFYTSQMAEAVDIKAKKFNEVWLYNVLQHVQDPIAVLKTAKRLGKSIRIFEWLDTPPHEGHPNTITKEMIDKVLGIDLKVSENMPEFTSGYIRAGHGYYQLGAKNVQG